MSSAVGAETGFVVVRAVPRVQLGALHAPEPGAVVGIPRLRRHKVLHGFPTFQRGTLSYRRKTWLAAEVDELQVGLVEVLQQSHGGLQVVTGLGGHAEFVTLDLGLD